MSVELLRKLYPSGTRMRLIKMGNDPDPIEPRSEGTVTSVDDAGHIHMKWDNGRTLALILGEDQFHKLFPKEDRHVSSNIESQRSTNGDQSRNRVYSF